ncbi:hypothetical protein PG984_013801 [Apiospora sp. TS-2023a]
MYHLYVSNGNWPQVFPFAETFTSAPQLLRYEEDYVPSALQQIEKLPLKSLEVTANAEDRIYRLVPSRLSRLARRILELSTDLQILRLHLLFTLGQPNGYLKHPQVTPETLSFSYTLGLPKLSLKHLQTLHVTESWLGAEEIQYILSTCTGLREFVYEVAEVYTTPSSYSSPEKKPLHLSDATGALEQIQGTLESLYLNFHIQNNISFHLEPPLLVQRLSSFSALRILLLEWSTICGVYGQNTENPDQPQAGDSQLLVDLLPESIETVVIIGCTYGANTERFERALDGLAAAKATGRFPNLRYLGCDIARIPTNLGFQRKHPGYAFDEGGSVRAMFGAAGVQVDYGLAWECRARPVSWNAGDFEGSDYFPRGEDPNADYYNPQSGSDDDL